MTDQPDRPNLGKSRFDRDLSTFNDGLDRLYRRSLERHNQQIEDAAAAYLQKHGCWPSEVWVTMPLTVGDPSRIGTGPRPKGVKLQTYDFGVLNERTVPGEQ